MMHRWTSRRIFRAGGALPWGALVLLLAVPALGAQEAVDNRFLAYEVWTQLLVTDPEAAVDRLVEWTEDRGGYFIERSPAGVSLRIPTRHVPAFRAVAEETADRVLVYNPSAQDLRRELLRIDAGITSREESLAQILRFIDGADVEGTLALEREIGSLMGEIEALRGRQRALRNHIALGRVVVSLSAQAAAIPETRPSSFAWINEMDLYRFLEEAGL